MSRYDVVLVGGGLQNGLIALALLDAHPDLKVLLCERDAALGGNHTWSFHLGSIPASARWFSPLIEHQWPRYVVRFPDLERTLEHAYATCSSEHFAKVVHARFATAPNAELRLGAQVTSISATSVRIGDEVIDATLVVDSRGPTDAPQTHTGYQKFVGLEVELTTPVDASTALLMDATVEQHDAFRFVYLLPFSPTRALVEDTYFANSPDLDVAAIRERVLAWLAAKKIGVQSILREEHGVLPMPWRQAPVLRQPPLVGGYRGGWFHPATGYSVPVALRLALHVAAHWPAVFGPAYDALADEHEGQARFAHLLNDLLFNAAKPELRWMIFRHFYELPDDLTLRFYSATLTAGDKRKMFLRRPPPGVSFLKAMARFSAWGFGRD